MVLMALFNFMVFIDVTSKFVKFFFGGSEVKDARATLEANSLRRVHSSHIATAGHHTWAKVRGAVFMGAVREPSGDKRKAD